MAKPSPVSSRTTSTPSETLTCDEQTSKNDHRLPGARRIGRILHIEREMPHTRKHHKAHKHPNPPSNQALPAPKMLNHIQPAKRGPKIHAAQNHLRHIRVANPRAVKHHRAVVEEVVRAGELLQRLQGHAQEDAVRHARALEHLDPAVPAALAGALGVQLLLDLGQLVDDHAVVRRHAVQLRHGLLGLVDAAVPEVVPRALREEDDPDAEDEAPEESDAQRDAPRPRVVHALRAEVDAVRDEDAQRDEQLVRAASVSKDQPMCGQREGKEWTYHTIAPRTCRGALSP